MATTFIDTNKIVHTKLPGSGEFAEVLNKKLCGAENVFGSLRWLSSGDNLDVRSDKNTHQLVYLMQGEAVITLGSQEHHVRKGSGVYVGPSEFAAIRQAGPAPLELFHLVVPELQN